MNNRRRCASLQPPAWKARRSPKGPRGSAWCSQELNSRKRRPVVMLPVDLGEGGPTGCRRRTRNAHAEPALEYLMVIQQHSSWKEMTLVSRHDSQRAAEAERDRRNRNSVDRPYRACIVMEPIAQRMGENQHQPLAYHGVGNRLAARKSHLAVRLRKCGAL